MSLVTLLILTPKRLEDENTATLRVWAAQLRVMSQISGISNSKAKMDSRIHVYVYRLQTTGRASEKQNYSVFLHWDKSNEQNWRCSRSAPDWLETDGSSIHLPPMTSQMFLCNKPWQKNLLAYLLRHLNMCLSGLDPPYTSHHQQAVSSDVLGSLLLLIQSNRHWITYIIPLINWIDIQEDGGTFLGFYLQSVIIRGLLGLTHSVQWIIEIPSVWSIYSEVSSTYVHTRIFFPVLVALSSAV